MPRKNQTSKHQPYFDTSACQSKRRFFNEKSAQNAAEIQMLQNPQLDLSVYKCDRCNGWHLTRKKDTT